MNMPELLPVISGLVLGGLLGQVTSAQRKQLGLPLTLVLALLATVVSGEFQISWAFLLLDFPLVSFSAYAGFSLVQRLRTARGEAPNHSTRSTLQ